MCEMGMIIFAQLISEGDGQNEITSVGVISSVTQRELSLPLLFLLEKILECGVRPLSRGIAGVPWKACFLGEEG